MRDVKKEARLERERWRKRSVLGRVSSFSGYDAMEASVREDWRPEGDEDRSGG